MLRTRAYSIIVGVTLALSGTPAVAQQLDMQPPGMRQLGMPQGSTTVRALTSQGFEIKAVSNGLLYLQKGEEVFECRLIVYRDSRTGQVGTRSACDPLD